MDGYKLQYGEKKGIPFVGRNNIKKEKNSQITPEDQWHREECVSNWTTYNTLGSVEVSCKN